MKESDRCDFDEFYQDGMLAEMINHEAEKIHFQDESISSAELLGKMLYQVSNLPEPIATKDLPETARRCAHIANLAAMVAIRATQGRF